MSRENVDLAKALIPPPGTDLATVFRDEDAFGRMSDALRPLLANDFQSAMFPDIVATAREGLEGFRQNWLDWLEPWATYRTTLEEAIDLGDRVLLLLRSHGRREDTDAEVEVHAAAICTFRDGKLARWEDWADRDAALKAVGVTN